MDIEGLYWLEDKERITDKYFQIINKNNVELFRIIKLHLKETEPILPLIEFVIERLEAVILLATGDKIWDAEIVLRAAIETAVKLFFITTADEVERTNRIDEFWNLLAEVNSLKQSEQAKKNLQHLGHLEIHNAAYSPLLLTDEEETALRAKWPRKERQKLEQKWSFTEIINSLSKNYRGHPVEIFTTLSHGYRMSSHVTHGDETGILIIADRNSRNIQDRELAYFAHYLRILSDVSVFCALIGVEVMHFLGLERTFFFKNQEDLMEIQALTEKYQSELFRGEQYDKYRK